MSRYGPGTFTDGLGQPSSSGASQTGAGGHHLPGEPIAPAGPPPGGPGAGLDPSAVFGQAPWMQMHPGGPGPVPHGLPQPGACGSGPPSGARGVEGGSFLPHANGSPLNGGMRGPALDPACGGNVSGLPSGFGTWNELIAGGVVDRSYIEQEAERRKQEIDRAMEDQVVQLENQCQEQRTSIQQQAEYHTQMAERQIESHKKQHQTHVTRQAEIQAYSILQRADMEKGRLGQEAARALSQQSEREKAVVLHDAMRKAEDVWRESQRALLEQAQKKKAEIDLQAKKRTEEIEAAVRQAVSKVYISPHNATSFTAYIPTPTAEA